LLAKTFIFTTKPITLNQLYPTNKHGAGRHKSKAYKTWIAQMVGELSKQCNTKQPLVTGKFGLEIQIGRQGSKADIDNLVKPISDLLVSLKLTPDDRHLDKLLIYRIDGHDNYISIHDMQGEILE
jgi:Holliday junction resolvase RusA-like endonuclease